MKKVAIITGGSNGLGYEICCQLLDKGWRVFNLDKRLGRMSNPHYKHFEVDVSKEFQLKAVNKRLKGIEVDLLINNASINHISFIHNLKNEDLNRVIQTNINGYFLTVKTFLNLLIPKKGTVLNITSTAAKNPMTASLAYNITKAAQNMMTKQMARELTKRHNITVFGIAPNKIEGTEMSQYVDKIVPKIRGWEKEFAEKYAKADSLVKAESNAKDIAKAIVFLVNEKRRHKQLSGCVLDWGLE